MEIQGTPIITEMNVIPVAGYDSMLMSLSGAHSPWFTRNLVILKDSSGHTGIGEIHGGEYTYSQLKKNISKVVGKPIGMYRKILDDIGKSSTQGDTLGIERLDISKLKYVVKAQWAIECALLDLLGQYLNLPMCELLGNGKQRDKIETLGYLFFVSDKFKAEPYLSYIDESDSEDEWFRLRRKEMLTSDHIVEQAYVLKDKYGFKNFKLKGGVFEGSYEMEVIKALKKQFPNARINIDPNGAWSLKEAIELCKDAHNILTYVEDPCGPELGYSSREVTAEFKNATNMPVATNMIATDWRMFYHAASLRSVDIVLADPHFWGFDGSVRMGQILNDWGLTWGSHSNNHFDITLTAFAHVGAAAPGNPTALDTHWIWQDGQDLLKNAPKIKDGYLEVPTGPGLGVTIDMDRVMEANKLYNQIPYKDRNDDAPMQYLIPEWQFNHKKPCLVR